MMKKILSIGIMMVMLLSVFAACAPSPSGTTTPAPADAPAEQTSGEHVNQFMLLEGVKIGVSTNYLADEFCVKMNYSIANNLKGLGATVTIADSQQDAEVQTKQIEAMLADGIQYLFANTPSMDACVGILEKVHQAGIPIIYFDGDNTWNDGVITRIGRDWTDVGQTQARGVIAAGVFQKYNRPVRIVEIYALAAERNQELVNGFYSVLQEQNIPYEVVGQLDSNNYRETAANALANFGGVEYDLVVSADINSAWGAVSTLEAQGKKPDDVRVIPMAAWDEETALALKENKGWFPCVTWSSPERAGALAVRVLLTYMYSEADIPRQSVVQVPVATHENIESFWEFKS